MKTSGSVLIRNGSLIDGTGAKQRRADLLLKNGKVFKIGKLEKERAEVIIDATGMVVTPGFIDVNTASDHYLSLFTDPSQENFLLQGVTTIIGGLHGSSLAPVFGGDFSPIKEWANTNKINLDWQSFDEFLNTVEKAGLAVNFGSFVGHSTIRRIIIGDERRDLDESELLKFKKLLNQSIDDGAFGLSTGLAYGHTQNVSYHELKEIVSAVADKNALFAVQPRSVDVNLSTAVEELINLSEEFQLKTILNTFVSSKNYAQEYRKALNLLEGKELIYYDTHPFDHQMVAIYTLLPEFARGGCIPEMCGVLESAHGREEILNSLNRIKGENFLIARAPGMEFLVGRTLRDFAKSHGLSIGRALLELMQITGLRAVLFKKDLLVDDSIRALKGKHCLLGSQSPSIISEKSKIKNIKGEMAFRKLLGMTKELETDLETIVEKLSAIPAKLLNLEDRGVLERGSVADLVILRDRKPVNVLVGGALAVKNGELIKNARHGQILRS